MVPAKASTGGRFVPQGHLAIPGDDFVYHSWEGGADGFWGWNQRVFSTFYDAQDYPLQLRMSQPKGLTCWSWQSLLCLPHLNSRLHAISNKFTSLCLIWVSDIWESSLTWSNPYAHFKNNIMREKSMLQIMEYRHLFFFFFLVLPL